METTNISISGRKIGIGYPPYVIAEISANHNGNIDNALELISVAKQSGAHAVKIQTYKPETITLNSNNDEFIIKEGLWKGRSLYDLYSEAHLPWEWHKELFDFANKIGITIFSTPFDPSAVDMLEDLNCPAYKIASFEVVDLPLIEYVASTKKPMIMSTGMANSSEIQEAIDTARAAGCKDLAILHCVSGYPAPSKDYNLLTMRDMQSRFGLTTGLSDHTIDNITAVASVALGACIIEKHFTLDRSGGGPDDSFSLEPNELANLCEWTQIAWEAMGCVTYQRQASEESSVMYRRSLYVTKDMRKGDKLTIDCVKSVRPGHGLPPKYLKSVLNKTFKMSVKKNTPLDFEMIESE